MTTLDLDDMQQRWLAQDRKLDQALRISARLWQRAEMQAPRASLGWLRLGATANIALGALCLLASGSYIHTVWGEWQLVLPGVALHLWLIGALGSEVLQLSWASGIDYDQAIVTIQQRLESLRQLNLRALRVLFLTGVPVWSVAFPVVIVHALFGVDLNQWFGSDVLFIAFLGHALLGWAVVWACGRLAQRFSGVPGVQQAVRSLAGYNLMQAEARLAALAEFERDPR